MRQIDKSKLVMVRNVDDKIIDKPLETKEIGYYRDSWNRFKKNKASLIAFIIICIVLFFVAFGPYMKKYNLPEERPNVAMRFENLPPKIPLLNKLGIFEGEKTITRGKLFLLDLNTTEFGEGIIKSGIPEELLENPNHPDYADVTQLTVVVDYYRYLNYIKSYKPENYFSAENQGATEAQRLGNTLRTVDNQKDLDYLVENNYIIDIVEVFGVEPYISYRVRVDQFKEALDQTPEDTYFWLGTNEYGRDLFTEIWKGARISLIMAVSVLVINYTIGLLIGSIVGYYGGVLDLLFDRVVEILLSIPFLSVLMLLMLSFGPKMWVIVLAFTATGWIGPYGTGRMQFYRFKNREYVLAARTLGASDWRIMFKHIFPNTLGLIITGMALAIPQFVFTESTFAFLNIIQYENATSVGMLINAGQAAMHSHPHLIIYPSIYIATLMISFNLFGNGLRDAFNPSLRGVE